MDDDHVQFFDPDNRYSKDVSDGVSHKHNANKGDESKDEDEDEDEEAQLEQKVVQGETLTSEQ